MHLKKIKLAGFKSFVDPTIIHFKSNQTAIVGPNGCGKSNIIDAVRWVMGESSAKQLRGESMADVIFNGTTNRQPVGQASIELFFDNDNTLLSGEYAKYNEIAIRREVNRDGMSNYYLNGARCRRKDIVGIFLGTGLGPRSYAIIEQGMIVQLIEAKPDELRVHLEEAAGISKYKERRRETENRIKHTRDNLDRLNDIREELASQLRHLKRQANAANRYKKLKQDQRLLKAELQALHWRTVHDQVSEQETVIKQQEIELEAKRSEISSVTAEIEKLRIGQTEANDIFNEVQKRYYSFGADVGRLEQQIQHNKERCSELNKDLTEINTSWQENQQHINNDQQNIDKLNIELKELIPQNTVAKEAENKANIELTTTEQTLREWQIAWDSFNDEAAQSMRCAEVEQTRIAHLQQRIDNETAHLEKLGKEKTELPDLTNLTHDISMLETECKNMSADNKILGKDILTKRAQINNQQQRINQLTLDVDKARHELQELHGRRVSLEVLQQAALGKDNEHINTWLEKYQLADNPRLAQDLQVETGWEKAVETVLNSHLEAVCIDDITSLTNALANLAKGNINLFLAHKKAKLTATPNTLATKVQSAYPVTELLSHIYIAESLAEALKLQKSLQSYESVVTREGIWLGSSWISVNSEKASEQGVLERKRELKELNQQIQEFQASLTSKEQSLQQSRSNLAELEKTREQMQQDLSNAISVYSNKYAEYTSKQTNLEHLKERTAHLEQEIAETQQQLTATEEQLNTVRSIWQEAEKNKSADDEQRTILSTKRDKLQENLQTARDEAKKAKQTVDELTMQIEFSRNQLQFLQKSLQRAESQIVSLSDRKENIIQSMQTTESPLTDLNRELEQALEKRLGVENELKLAKQNLENIEHNLRIAETKHAKLQTEEQEIRGYLEQIRIEGKALQVRCATYEEQIAELDFSLETLLQEIPETAELTEWEEKLENIGKRVERLGPINLAAIDEYEQKQERKNYLDAQNEDLEEALTTLENAMHKIDRETRARFKQTFDTVNDKFGELFPVVFGGGKAHLEMTSDDLLSTGVEILAQPPGKHNVTIHLLSGGEKALTAIALVFAIFQLNPAPFCMLDEVDAPLDDNNIIRFCNLVSDMAKKIQFIFVTHNKATMEMAEQLAGITMQEAGVSRIVSVDIQEAVSMAGT
jgi:chromosome segregation protein